MQFDSYLQMCRNMRSKFLSWTFMYTTIKSRDRQTDKQFFSGLGAQDGHVDLHTAPELWPLLMMK